MAGSCFYLSDIESIYVFDASVTLSLNVISQVLLVAFCHFIANADESQHDLFNCLVLLCISSVFSGDLAVFNLYLYNNKEPQNNDFCYQKVLKSPMMLHSYNVETIRTVDTIYHFKSVLFEKYQNYDEIY